MSGSQSPYIDDLPTEEALAAWRAACASDGCPERLEAVTLGLEEAVGRVTAEPVFARRSSPAYDAAAMDGIAVSAADTVGASDVTPLRLTAGNYETVDTGDPIPSGCDAVIMREHVHRVGDQAEVRAAVPPYQHVRSIGEDVAATELLLPQGTRLSPIDVAAIASSGSERVVVYRQPVVTIIPTGDEIRPIGSPVETGEITDTNSLMLAAQARRAGCIATCTEIVPDDPAQLVAATREAAAAADLVILVAGSSRGRDDYTAEVVAEAGTLAVHGVAVRPGHPVVLGAADQTPVLGAPGYPLSAALTFDIFAAPVLAQLEGAAATPRQQVTAHLARKLPSVIGMDDWVRVRLGEVEGRIVAAPLSRGAGMLTSLVRADGIVVIPAGVEGHHAGEQVSVRLIRDLDAVRRTIVAVGSHDLVVDLAASALREVDPHLSLASTNVGSLGGLVALRDGLCHLAGSHLLDPDTGEYTLPYLERVMPDAEVAVIRLVHREQGLIVPSGNPHGLESIADLVDPQIRYVNRQRGAGTRVLLDHELTKRGADPAGIDGYEREEHTHLAVAAAVAAGRADCGLGIRAAATAFDLDFVPVAEEPYDLVMRADTVNAPIVAPLLELLASAAFKRRIAELGGYSTAETGRRIA